MRVVVAAALLVFVSCAEPVPNAPVPQDVASGPGPSTSVGPAVDVSYHCSGLDLGDNPDAWAGMTPFEDGIESLFVSGEVVWDVDLDTAHEEYKASRNWWESREWRIATDTSTNWALLGYDTASGRYGYVAFMQVGDEFLLSGWGDCQVEAVIEGFGTASFELDPANPPDAVSSEITVLATERECANGEAPDGRHVEASTIETDNAVQILILIEPIAGGATCPGNPSFPVTVSLAAPLADRLILDDSTGPPTAKEWPIPTQAGELQVWLAGNSPLSGNANVFGWTGPNPGALVVSPNNWSEQPMWFQTFTVDEITITGFVTRCDDCDEECVAEACDALPRFGSECSLEYDAIEGFDTVVTITYTESECTIDVDTNQINS